MLNVINAKGQIESLRKEIIQHDLAYDAGTPTITDSEYDRLYAQLVQWERQYPEFESEESPTKRIYSKVVEGLKKMQHSQPMLSQEKAHTEEDIMKLLKKAKGKILAQQKLDGLTIVLEYNEGVLQQAVTRGDGYVGEIVTHAIRNVSNLPIHIDFDGYLKVRAEAIIPFADFERVNVDGKYASPRNLVSGSVRNLAAGVAKDRGVQLIVFDLIDAEGQAFLTDSNQLEFLRRLDFPVVETAEFAATDTKAIVDYCLTYNTDKRPNLPYMIDGLVLKIDELDSREKLGYTSKYPKWAIAFKFDSLDATTKMPDVIWTVGPSGQLTPNAVLEPVEIDNVTIARASLANIDNIRKRDIRIGDTVVVARANDVIPQVVSAVTTLRTGAEKEVEIPTHCPSCGEEVVVNGWKVTCVNPNCSAQMKRKLETFVSRGGLNINGLGDKTIEAFFEQGLVKTYTDIYQLKNRETDLMLLEGFGKSSIEKMLKGIEESKKASLSKVLFALSIPNCGEGTSKRMAKTFKSMDAIMSLGKEDLAAQLMAIDDIGDTVSQSVVDFFMNEENRETIEFLLKDGFAMKEEVNEVVTSAGISGKAFVITGALENGSRDDYKKMIEDRGGKVSGSVSKNTNYLVLGGYNHITGDGLDLTSSKSKKAIEVGTEIISEAQLMDLMA